MEFRCHVSRGLHEEHLRLITLLNRLEETLVRHHKADALDTGTPEVASLLGELAVVLDSEVDRHFSFEEAQLFPRLEEAGDQMIATVLRGDHEVLRPLARDLVASARRARDEGLRGENWQNFHRLGLELVERQMTHIQREEMALLPLLDDLIDEESDQRLWSDYAAA